MEGQQNGQWQLHRVRSTPAWDLWGEGPRLSPLRCSARGAGCTERCGKRGGRVTITASHPRWHHRGHGVHLAQQVGCNAHVWVL